MATERSKAKEPRKAKPAVQKEAAPVAAQDDGRNALEKRRTIVGTVVSNKMQKTIVVRVDRRVRHSLYKKYVENSQRYKAHDEKNEAKMGDQVVLVESRPMSRDKRWVLQSIIRKAGQAPEANV